MSVFPARQPPATPVCSPAPILAPRRPEPRRRRVIFA